LQAFRFRQMGNTKKEQKKNKENEKGKSYLETKTEQNYTQC